MNEENIERWITANGNHIPIRKGQTEKQAIRAFRMEQAKKKSIFELKEELAQPFDEDFVTAPITPITDEAIQKIPIIEIPGYSSEECKYIAEQHKELLQYARSENDNKEVAFVFRKDLTDKSSFWGSDNVIDFGSGLIGKGDNLFVMHNHPRNSSFSKTDIDEFINNNNIKTLSVVKNNGEVEIIIKSENYSQREAYLYKERYKRKLAPNKTNAEYDKMVLKFLSYCEKESIIKWIK